MDLFGNEPPEVTYDESGVEVLLGLFDEVHDTIHMMRHMASAFLEKGQDLEKRLADALGCALVDLDRDGCMTDVATLFGPVPDNVVDLFPDEFN